jgi:hypothetical protein
MYQAVLEPNGKVTPLYRANVNIHVHIQERRNLSFLVFCLSSHKKNPVTRFTVAIFYFSLLTIIIIWQKPSIQRTKQQQQQKEENEAISPPYRFGRYCIISLLVRNCSRYVCMNCWMVRREFSRVRERE